MPVDEKIKILVQLQKIADGLRPSLKRNQRVGRFEKVTNYN
jgi:hypothetical protein